MNTQNLGLNGRVKLSVIREGKVVRETGWIPNLLLDQGLDRIAVSPICDLFLACAAGTSLITNEGTAKSGVYDCTTGGILTKNGIADNFTDGEVGTVIKIQVGVNTPHYARIISKASSAQVTISPVPAASITAGSITPIITSRTGLDNEVARTSTLSSASGENGTVGSLNLREMTRTFIFPAMDTVVESPDMVCSLAAGTVTRTSGAGIFQTTDVGKTLTFDTGETGEITAYTSSTIVTIDNVTDTVAGSGIRLFSEGEEVVTGTYEQDDGAGAAGNLVTRVTGSRSFTDADIGKAIYFPSSGTEAIITGITSATIATVDTSRLLAAQAITLYGFIDISEVGFSHTSAVGDNLNIRVYIPGYVRIASGTPLTPSEQLKVTYTMKVQVTPASSVTVAAGGIISGGFNTGNISSVIETVALSSVNSSGATDTSEPELEPYFAGKVGLSTDGSALVSNQIGRVRDQNVATATLNSLGYVSGSRSQTFQGNFPLGDAVRSDWRAIMLYNPTTHRSALTCLFASAQTKGSANTLTLNFLKTWDYNGNL